MEYVSLILRRKPWALPQLEVDRWRWNMVLCRRQPPTYTSFCGMIGT
jgi:hypothetical protein